MPSPGPGTRSAFGPWWPDPERAEWFPGGDLSRLSRRDAVPGVKVSVASGGGGGGGVILSQPFGRVRLDRYQEWQRGDWINPESGYLVVQTTVPPCRREVGTRGLHGLFVLGPPSFRGRASSEERVKCLHPRLPGL